MGLRYAVNEEIANEVSGGRVEGPGDWKSEFHADGDHRYDV